eukprot:6483982-Amphidinium_carterae.1
MQISSGTNVHQEAVCDLSLSLCKNTSCYCDVSLCIISHVLVVVDEKNAKDDEDHSRRLKENYSSDG